jgi:hypothetical protein
MSIDPLNLDSIKFHTCKYRSEEEQEKLIKRCSCQGGDYILRGYWCDKRQIFQVTPETCQQCPVYEAK